VAYTVSRAASVSGGEVRVVVVVCCKDTDAIILTDESSRHVTPRQKVDLPLLLLPSHWLLLLWLLLQLGLLLRLWLLALTLLTS
jgi:hypothetical protein